MNVTDLPIMSASEYPAGCKCLLHSLPDNLSVRIGDVPGFGRKQFAIWDAKRRKHVMFDIGYLDPGTLRAALRNLGYSHLVDANG